MLINKEIAKKMEACIKQTHIEVTKTYAKGLYLEINSGAACFSGFDSYLSQVVGWGFDTEPKQFEQEIMAIERFYQQLNHPRVDIEFCPFAGNSLVELLSERGYRVSELNNISVLDLDAYKQIRLTPESFLIREVKQSEIDDWALNVACGFGFPEAKEQFSHYARASGVSAFGVYDNDILIAGATIAMHGEVCDLGVTSTLPAYRGKGLQKKLILSRLNVAKNQGLRIATVTTDPGSISDLNVQKLGFHCAYTRIKMSKCFI